MKKAAVLLYDSFCTFEISPVLEILALSGKPITIFGISKQAIRSEDGLNELAQMVEWDENLSNPIKDGYIIAGNIITSVSYNFIKWALAFGKMVGLHIPPKTFGM